VSSDREVPQQRHMTEEGHSAADASGDRLPRQPTASRGPDELSDLPKESYFAILRRVAKEFGDDSITVWAAALTYYGVLSIFPGLLLIVTSLRLFGADTVQKMTENVTDIAPGAVASILNGAAKACSRASRTPLVCSQWSACSPRYGRRQATSACS
jgi:membrane protein